MVRLGLIAAALATAVVAAAQPGVPAAWPEERVAELIERTETIRLAPDISHLSEGEREAVAKLIEVGRIFQDVYEEQRHRSALAARGRLASGSPEATLYRLFQGPIATTLRIRHVG